MRGKLAYNPGCRTGPCNIRSCPRVYCKTPLRMRVILLSLLTLSCLLSCAQQPPMVPAPEAINKLETDIPVLLQKSDVPGLAIALIRDGRVVWSKGFGVSNTVTKKPVTGNTIFEAASL